MKKTINALSISLLLIFTLAPDARGADLSEGEVYVAGQTFTLEQALSQALAENPADTKQRFWVVVSGRDAARLGRSDADSGLLDSIKRVRERGGLIYVCQSDMMAHGITPSDLIPQVAPIQGFGAPASGSAQPPQPERLLPQDLQHARLILRSCADSNASDSGTAETPNAQ
jgi:hypothetical protein